MNATAPIYDLILQGGHVICPASGIDGVMDVAIVDGKIARLSADMLPSAARQAIDVRGKLVLPGLIDTHAHVYRYVTGRNRVSRTAEMTHLNRVFGAHIVSVLTGQYEDPEGQAIYYRIPLGPLAPDPQLAGDVRRRRAARVDAPRVVEWFRGQAAWRLMLLSAIAVTQRVGRPR